MRPYELMYLVQPQADEERLAAVGDRLQQAITTLGGKIEKVGMPVRRRLAYEIGKYRDRSEEHTSELQSRTVIS